MGLFSKKAKSPEEFLAEYPVRPEYEPLLTLGAPLIERDAKENSSFVLADPRKGAGAKHLFPMWGISDPTSLESVVEGLVAASRSPEVKQDEVAGALTKTTAAFEKALGGSPLPGYDFSAARVAQLKDLGGVQLEYAAYLTRLEMGMPWGNEAHAATLLNNLLHEVSQRFETWADYMISAVAADKCVEVSFGFPTAPPVYVRLARMPHSYFAKYPLTR